ncbi:MAG: phosphotransferase, partial [Candidatus Promineifilaceae bacterium]
MKFLDRSNPQFSENDVKRIAHDLFGLEGNMRSLSSERDQNRCILTESGEGYVLKIAHLDEAEGVIDFQTKALQHLEMIDPTLPVPRVVPTLTGEPYTRVTHPNGEAYLVRVVTYLRGEVVHHAVASNALRENIGRMMARTDLALRGFFHPNARHELLWDITQCAHLRPHTCYIPNADARLLVENTLDHFLERTLP